MKKQYMKYIASRDMVLEVNKELEKGAKVVLMVPFLRTDNWGSNTAGYHVLFEKEEEEKSETITEFADRCRECGAKYGKLLKEAESKSNTSKPKTIYKKLKLTDDDI